jgi:hypothetical protein
MVQRRQALEDLCNGNLHRMGKEEEGSGMTGLSEICESSVVVDRQMK